MLFNWFTTLGECQQLTGQILGPTGTDFRLFQVFEAGMAGFGALFGHGDIAEDSGEDIVEIMSNAPCQGADTFKLLHFMEFFADAVFFSHVPENQDNPGDLVVSVADRSC